MLQKVLIAIAAVLIYSAGIFGAGIFYTESKLAKQVVKVEAKRAAVAEPIIQKQIEVQTKIKYVTQTLTKEVIQYVPLTTVCSVPESFRVFHDAAANGIIPEAPGGTDDSGLTLTEIAGTVAANYGTYQEVAARLTGLQEWVRAQQSLRE